jgi:hypothetical protein
MKSSKAREVKSGGRVTTKSAGTVAKGGGKGRCEFEVQTAGTVAGGLSKQRSEFAQHSAGEK